MDYQENIYLKLDSEYWTGISNPVDGCMMIEKKPFSGVLKNGLEKNQFGNPLKNIFDGVIKNAFATHFGRELLSTTK